MNLLDNLFGFIISLCMGVLFLFRRRKFAEDLIGSTLKPFREQAKQNEKRITFFVISFGCLLVSVSLIFLYKIIMELKGHPVSW